MIPSKRASIVNLADVLIEALRGMVTGTLGETGAKYFGFIATIFIFILLGNLLGLTPHGSAPTSSVNTTFALGIATFVYYNLMGVKEQGFVGYLKHFLMGMGPAGIVIAALELVSQAIRPLSLGIRLFVNMYVDHTVVLSFQNVFAWLFTSAAFIVWCRC